MTKNQALALCTTEEQKQAVERMATAAVRLKNPAAYEKEGATNESILAAINSSVATYNKKAAKRADEAKIAAAIKQAISYKASTEEIVKAIEGIYKQKAMNEIDAKIAALQAEKDKLGN